MKYEAFKIYKETIYDKPGLCVVGETEHGNHVFIDSGTYKNKQGEDKPYTNIKIYEVFKAPKAGELRLARKNLSPYDKKLGTTFYLMRIAPEILPQVAEILIMLYNEIYGKEYKLKTAGMVEKVRKEQDEMSELLKKTGIV